LNALRESKFAAALPGSLVNIAMGRYGSLAAW